MFPETPLTATRGLSPRRISKRSVLQTVLPKSEPLILSHLQMKAVRRPALLLGR
jgi:hypothetical protein